MGLQADILAALDSVKQSLPDAVVNVAYLGRTCTGLTYSNSILTEQLSFAETADGESTVVIKTTDIDEPKYGNLINVDGVDRLIKSASIDGVKGAWFVVHTIYYNEWCNIYNDQADPDSSTVYTRIKVRVMDPTDEDYTQFADGYFATDMFIAVIRKNEWPYDALPKVGYVLNFDDERATLYVSDTILSNGDIRMVCKPEGG